MPKMLNGVPRYGGKGRPELNKWIRSLLPEDVPVYCEPFGGVVSVLLNRPPAKCEIVNDLSSDMYNWLRVVRDYPGDFARLLTHTPWSRDAFNWAVKFLGPSPQSDWLYAPPEYVTRRALAYHVLLEQRVGHGETEGGWALERVDGVRSTRPRGVWEERVMAIHPRIINVQLENRDAADVIDRVGRVQDSLTYADPPYSLKHRYWHDIDRERLTDSLLACRGRAAVSGYPGDWDHLGWTAHCFSTRQHLLVPNVAKPRTEVLWTNY